MSTTRPLRGGLIGCGNVARHHLAAWSRIPEAHLAALCETDPARLRASLERAPGAAGFADAGAMFDSVPLDFVEVCTGPAAHRPLTELAARHGVHVLCQKPVAAEREELLAMIEACRAADVRFMVHENWRFRPWNRALREAIAAGEVGRPVRLRLAHHDTRALRPDGFDEQPFLATMPRLILTEMGCHLVDVARFLLGEVASVACTTGRFGPGHPGEDVATLSLRFASGALGQLDMSWCTPPDHARPEWALNETTVEGTEATLRVELDGSLRRTDLWGHSTRLPVNMPPDDEVYVAAFEAAQRHFVLGVSGDGPLETDGADTLRTMDVVWAGYRSAAEGRTVAV